MYITLRPIEAKDREFLYRVYASTREDELAMTGWSGAEKEKFLNMQFEAQHSHYQKHFTSAAFDVILCDGEPVGRLYVERCDEALRIIDIALLTEQRRKGIGTRLLRDLITEAGGRGQPVSIHVEHNNPALGLYQRLGFRRIGDTGVYYLMERPPGPVA